MRVRVASHQGLNWMLAAMICVSVAIHALVFWWLADDFPLSGTGAAPVMLDPGFADPAEAVPQPPAPLTPAGPVASENRVLPESDPDVSGNHSGPDMPVPGAFPPMAPVVKWKGGAGKPVAVHKASIDKVFKAAGVSSDSGGAVDLEKTYLAMVRQQIAAMRNYPVTARMRHLTGVVVIRFTIGAGGGAEGVKIVSGSGNGLLDDAALDAVISASPFPPPPKSIPAQGLVVNVPIRFELSK